MGGKKEALEIATHSARCTGCLRCQLECSFTHTGLFNPSKSAIQVCISDFSDLDQGIKISFSDDCDKCGACIDACPYGALDARRDHNRRR